MKPSRRCLSPVLDRYITIEAPTSVTHAGGQRHEAFSMLACTWADIESIEARETLVDDRLVLIRRHQFIVRFRADLTAAHRLVWQGRYFAIISLIDPDERGLWLKLVTEEVTP